MHEIIGPLIDLPAPELLMFTRMTGDLVKAMRALPAADRRGGRRRLRRRRRDPRDGLATCASAPRAARRRSCSPASAWPAATWAPARCCRASSARAAPPSCSTPAASLGGEEAERWGFFNRLCEPDGAAGRGAGAGAPSWPAGPTFAHGMTKTMLHQEWAMGIDAGDRSRGAGAGAVHADRGLRPRLSTRSRPSASRCSKGTER